jgi:hypothetical protein
VIAMTLVLESLYITLPTGATISLCSPVPLLLLAILVDGRLAVLSGWVCGVLVLFLVPEWRLVNWGQFFVEHMVCLSCLGFAGVFGTDRRWKILCGIAAVVRHQDHGAPAQRRALFLPERVVRLGRMGLQPHRTTCPRTCRCACCPEPSS